MAVGWGQPAPKGNHAKQQRDAQRQRERDWQRIRQVVLCRDDRRCRVCHGRDGIDVHHIRFRSRGGGNTTANLACLCRVCHAEIHAYRLALSGNADKKLKIERMNA